MDLFGSSLNKKAMNVLKRHVKIRKHTVMHDIKIRYKDEAIHIDHIYIGEFGVLLVDTYDFKGSIYGGEKDKSWAYYEKDGKSAIKNPVLDLEEKTAVLRELFASEKVYKLSYYCAAVIPDSTTKLEVYAKSDKLMRLGAFKKYMSKSMFDEDKNIKIQAVMDALKRHIVE